MSDFTADFPLSLELDAAKAPRKPSKVSWPLMGDVVTVRAGVPEHLIQWNRAAGEDDPEPQL
ncbi:MAG: hypothetical protein GKR98_09140 [Boseongicola sp.]|nr:MAG: hypothetical protein GKR98_09140 [Boseongicola sp.]